MNERNSRAYRMTRCDYFKKNMLFFDIYKQPFSLLLPDGKNNYRTFSGALMTIFTFIFVMIYGSHQIRAMIKLEHYKLQIQDLNYYYSDQDVIDASHGFMIAASIPAVIEEQDEEIPPEIGALNFYRKSWDTNNTDEVIFTKLKTRKCQESDFNFGQESGSDGSLMYPTVHT